MRAKVLREKRLKLITDIRATYAKEDKSDYQWSAADAAEITRMEAELTIVEEQLARAERDEQLSMRLNDLGRPAERGHESGERGAAGSGDPRRAQRDSRIGREDFDGETRERDEDEPTYRDRALALQAWFRSGTDEDLTRDQRQACQRLHFNPTRRVITLDIGDEGFISNIAEEFRQNPATRVKQATRELCRERVKQERSGMSAFDGPVGGYLVPIDFLNRLEENMVAFSGMEQVAEIIRTETGAPMPWPTFDDTGNEGEIIGEKQSIDGSTDPGIAQLMWYAWKFHSKMLKVPFELLEDNAFGLAGRVGGWLGMRLGRRKNRAFTNGTGVKEPRGIIPSATLGVTTAAANAITLDEVINLQASIDPAYTSNARFMCHRLIISYLRKLKDSQNRYLWEPSVKAGVPDVLLGDPVTYNTSMDSTVATTKTTLIYGALDSYKIREVRGIRLKRLDERYADTDEVAFDALQRCDGGLLDAGTAPVKKLVQA